MTKTEILLSITSIVILTIIFIQERRAKKKERKITYVDTSIYGRGDSCNE